eukprot:PhF_6_TR4601/c1_g1_i1/m.6458/K12399/AP3S; AP-3 complex subunit sigma
MIKGVFIINNHGKPRMVRFFERLTLSRQHQLISEIYRAASKRTEDMCNFIENFNKWPSKDTRVIYRHYATLYFIMVVDGSESELAILDLIQVFVEILDKCFENVCELDLVFHSEKVHCILNEIVMGGVVQETNKEEVIRAVDETWKHGKK